MTLVYAPGGLVSVPPAPIRGSGAPPANFKGQLGQMYLDTSVSPADIYFYNGLTWQISTAELDTLTTDDATVVVPVSGNINLLGGSNINTTGSGDDATINLDNSPSVSGSLTAGTTITATLGNITATNGDFVASTQGTGILLDSAQASGAAASPVVVNGRSGRATFTSVSIAAAADLTLTITNSSITAATTEVLISMSGATTGSALSIKSKTASAGSLAIVVTNGTGATTTTEDIQIDFLVINA